jgi:hypothetical protein
MHDKKIDGGKKYTSFAGNFNGHVNVPVQYSLHRPVQKV